MTKKKKGCKKDETYAKIKTASFGLGIFFK